MSEGPGLTAWRLVKEDYAQTAFDGEGAFRYGGRWNSKGTRVCYASGTLTLAALEWLVHLDTGAPLPALVAIQLKIPPDCVRDFPFSGKCSDNRSFPPLAATRATGDGWVRDAGTAALRVPSAVIPVEWNFVLNPQHPGFASIHRFPPQAFSLDERLGGHALPVPNQAVSARPEGRSGEAD